MVRIETQDTELGSSIFSGKPRNIVEHVLTFAIPKWGLVLFDFTVCRIKISIAVIVLMMICAVVLGGDWQNGKAIRFNKFNTGLMRLPADKTLPSSTWSSLHSTIG